MFEEIVSILLRPVLNALGEQTRILNLQFGAIMADVQQLQQAVTDLQTSLTAALDRVAEDVQHLKDDHGIDPTAIDPIIQQIDAAKQSLDALDPDADFPAEEPPPASTTG